MMVLKPILKTIVEAAKKPATVQFPDQKERIADNYRGIHKLDIDTCISCGACARICPNQTITMVEIETSRGTKQMPQINLERCLFCALCEEVCPTKCLVLTKDYDFESYDRREFIKRPEELK
ncbi:MAG: NuoI/complex I 23 kDa subunit family protein [Candidatus Micrarchaeia archaeon]